MTMGRPEPEFLTPAALPPRRFPTMISSMKSRLNGNGSLKALAKRMDTAFADADVRFVKIEHELKGLKKDMKRQRQAAKDLMNHVIYLDEDLQKHKADRLVHSIPR